ncbi:unnamed protein product, partial [marine sediment metagenome]
MFHINQHTCKGVKNHTIQEIEKNIILNRLYKYDWNKTRTAANLGIGVTTLWRK